MSLYQCERCGGRENTALTDYHWNKMKGEPLLCSECETGTWHGRFEKLILPKGMFITNHKGNLAHKETGDTELKKYQIKTGSPALSPAQEEG